VSRDFLCLSPVLLATTAAIEMWSMEAVTDTVRTPSRLPSSSRPLRRCCSFELFAETQRDITPEQAAQKLREKDAEVHYKEKLWSA
jgi:galactose-1-phosphate uridylyltransferase